MAVRLMPEFLRNAVMTDEDGGIWFTLYMPLSVETDTLSIETDTEYPFRENIIYKVTRCDSAKHSLHFRIPAWCRGASLSLNGKKIFENISGCCFAEAETVLKAGDVLELLLPMEITVSAVDDSDRSKRYPIAIERGPLLYALPIPEQWIPTQGHPVTRLPDGWSWYNVKPVIPPSGLDVYDDMGARKNLISWNVALDENISAKDITAENIDTHGYPWETPKVKLIVPAFKAPYSYPPYPNRTFEPYGHNGYVFATEPLSLELIPFGCTALQISYFPRAERDITKFEILPDEGIQKI